MTQSISTTTRSPISPAQAAQELLARRRARRDLLGFTEYTTPLWRAGKIHREICAQLGRVISGEIDRLMLLCPPQHGKSEIASRRYPAFVLGHMPTEDIISASATETLASGFGRDVRNCVASREYRNVFPDTQLAEDSQAKGQWSTRQGGSYYAVGVGGQLFGRGGMGIIDDPFGSWADAQSATQRDKVWDWYTGTFYNRIRPGKPIIIIQHRMHEADLAGRLIERQKVGGDRWEIVYLPALIDDPPWVERYDSAALTRIRDNMAPRQWSALYLQQPSPEEGTYFQRDWFKRHAPQMPAEAKAGRHIYITSDYAVTEGGGDCTEHAVWAYGADGLRQVDWWHGQTDSAQWIEALLDLISRWRPLCYFGEQGVIEKAVRPMLIRRMRERQINCRLEWIPSVRDKPTRARPIQAMAAMGKVSLLDNDVGERLLSAMLKFPAGTPDDPVDAASLMGMAIDMAHPGVVKLADAKPASPAGYAARSSRADQSWL